MRMPDLREMGFWDDGWNWYGDADDRDILFVLVENAVGRIDSSHSTATSLAIETDGFIDAILILSYVK